MTLAVKEALTHFHIELERTTTISGEVSVDSLDEPDTLDGQIQSYTAPVLNNRTLDWPTHSDGSQEVDGGLEAMACGLVSGKYSGDFFALYLRSVKLTCYNALRTGIDAKLFKEEITGVVKTVDGGEKATGTTPPTVTMTMNVVKYKIYYGGDTPAHVRVDVDIDARKRVIGGVDQLAAIREVLGVA